MKAEGQDEDVRGVNVDISLHSQGSGTVIDLKNSTDIGSIQFFGDAVKIDSLVGKTLCVEK